MPEILDADDADELVRACRTMLGDELRSVVYITEDDVEQLYLRDDLEPLEDLVGFAETEQQGFRSQSTYDDADLGDYYGTIRMFDQGFLTRVIEGDHGAWVSTDSMSIDRFEELSQALRGALGGVDSGAE